MGRGATGVSALCSASGAAIRLQLLSEPAPIPRAPNKNACLTVQVLLPKNPHRPSILRVYRQEVSVLVSREHRTRIFVYYDPPTQLWRKLPSASMVVLHHRKYRYRCPKNKKHRPEKKVSVKYPYWCPEGTDQYEWVYVREHRYWGLCTKHGPRKCALGQSMATAVRSDV